MLNSIDGVDFKEAFQNRQKIVEGDLEISYIGLNDLLQNKVASGRKQDIQDVKEIKKVLPIQNPPKEKGVDYKVILRATFLLYL